MSASSVPKVYPRGWFVVAFSNEVPALGVKKMRYFGEELVAFRGEDGVVRILDAYCSHLGAHLGAGGVVVGNAIQCPFHAWKYCGTGECIDIPYSKSIPFKARQRAWLTREVNGVILLHHDPDGAPPLYQIPVIPEHGTASWLPWTQNMYTIKTHPREIVENLADKGHFPFVHKTTLDEFTFEVDGHIARQKAKGTAVLHNGGVDKYASTTTYHGPGYLLMRMDGALQNYMLVAHTPVDHENVDMRMGVMLRIVGDRARTESYVDMYMDNMKRGFEDDFRIWENKTFREHPVLCEGDGPIMKLRRWYKQFYDPIPSATAVTTRTPSSELAPSAMSEEVEVTEPFPRAPGPPVPVGDHMPHQV
jgi:3-ketosteroid 9alpha-monooxygenase subunit A